jgi:hypothetical protein
MHRNFKKEIHHLASGQIANKSRLVEAEGSITDPLHQEALYVIKNNFSKLFKCVNIGSCAVQAARKVILFR